MTEDRSLWPQPVGMGLGLLMLLAVLAVWQGETTYVKYLVALLSCGGVALAAAVTPGIVGVVRPGRALLQVSVLAAVFLLITLVFGGIGTYTMAQMLWAALVLALAWLAPGQGFLTIGSGWPGFMAWAAAGVSAVGLLQYAGVLHGGFDTYGGADAPSVFGLSNFAVEFVVPLVPLVWPDGRSTGRARWVRLGIAILLLAYVAASGVRAALLGLGVAALVWGLVVRGARVYVASGIAAIAAIVLFVAFRPGASDAFRLEAWRSALNIWLDNPMGVGLGWFADAVQSYLTPEAMARQLRTMHRVGDPHNELIRLLVELGPLGAALIFASTAYVSQRRERLTQDPALAAGLGAWIAMAMVAFPGHTVSGALSAGLLLSRWREAGFSAPVNSPKVSGRLPMVVLAIFLVAAALPAWQLTRSSQSLLKAQNYMRRAIPLPANAVGYYRDAARAAPYDRTAQIGLMTAGYALRDFVVTAKTGEKYLDARFVAPDSLIQALVAAVESKNAALAETWYYRHKDMIDQLTMVDRMTIGLTLHQGRRYAAAAEILGTSDILATTDGRLMLAQIMFDQRQYAEALVLIDEGLALPNATMGLRMARALALEHLRRLDEAQAYLEQIVAEKPQYAQTYLHLARLAWLRHDQEQTWNYVSTAFGYDRGLRIEPNKEQDPLFREIYQYVGKRLAVQKLGAIPQAQKPQAKKKK